MKKLGTGSARRVVRARQSAGDSGPVIVWAVDPFHDDISALRHSCSMLLPIARALKLKIQPVCYVDSFSATGGASLRFPLLPVASDIPELLEEQAEEILRALRRGALGRSLMPALFLHNAEGVVPTLNDKISAIAKQALKLNAPFVAIRSHARRGLTRLFMGSFAESFLLHARVPTLFLNPRSLPVRKLTRAVFATDFGEGSRDTFKLVLPLMREAKLRVTVLYHLRIPQLSPLFEDTTSRRQLDREYRRLVTRAEKLAATFIRLAWRNKVRAEFQLMRDERGGSCSEALVLAANKLGCDLMVMAAQSSVLAASVVGATSRQVARAASFPVLLYRTGKC